MRLLFPVGCRPSTPNNEQGTALAVPYQSPENPRATMAT